MTVARAGSFAAADDLVRVDLRVNGVAQSFDVAPRWTLADALRERLGLTGTHVGCEHGICGTCTVLLDGRPVRSCLVLAVQAAGASVETVEGLGDADQLHPLQHAFHERHALQCGFCTPGFLMLAVGLLRAEPDAPPERVREILSSNLCRCTGYTPIVEAVLETQRALAR